MLSSLVLYFLSYSSNFHFADIFYGIIHGGAGFTFGFTSSLMLDNKSTRLSTFFVSTFLTVLIGPIAQDSEYEGITDDNFGDLP